MTLGKISICDFLSKLYLCVRRYHQPCLVFVILAGDKVDGAEPQKKKTREDCVENKGGWVRHLRQRKLDDEDHTIIKYKIHNLDRTLTLRQKERSRYLPKSRRYKILTKPIHTTTLRNEHQIPPKDRLRAL